MSNPIYFAPLRVPFVDPETGIISREWQLLLQGMFTRIGGTSGQSVNDVLARLTLDEQAAGQVPPMTPAITIDDQSPPTIPDATFDDLLGELRQIRDVVAELAKSLQGLQQGIVS
jgi:hypothetical protein